MSRERAPHPDQPDFPSWHVWALMVAAVAAKAVFIFSEMPSMWIWSDELFYYLTAYDLVHWGKDLVPHDGFLFYPPLTSILILPTHLLGLDTVLRYPAALVLLSIIHALGALAMYRVVDEVFAVRSRALLLFLLIGPPAYFSLALMSETLFIALFGWLLYFFVRMEKTSRLRYALLVGVFAVAMNLTRKTGVFISVGLVASLAAAWSGWGRREGDDFRSVFRRYGAALGCFLILGLAWRAFRIGVLEARYGFHTVGGYIDEGLLPALSNLDTSLLLVRKLTANFLYVSLATYGVVVPLLLGYLVARPRPRTSTDRLIDRLFLLAGGFMACCAGAAAVHMFIMRGSANPRYHMYGRYMEYFSPVLIAICFGLWATRFRWGRRGGATAFAATVLLVGTAMVTLPASFYPLTLSKTTLVPNYMGLGWLFGLGVDSRGLAAIAMLVVGLSGVGAILAGSRRRPSPLAVVGAAVLFFGVATVNLVEVSQRASRKSHASNESYGRFGRYVRANPATFASGLFIDSSVPKNRKSKRSDNIHVRKLCGDFPDFCLVGHDARPYLGKVPVLSRHRLKYEILYAPEGTKYRLYGVDRAPRRRRSDQEKPMTAVVAETAAAPAPAAHRLPD